MNYYRISEKVKEFKSYNSDQRPGDNHHQAARQSTSNDHQEGRGRNQKMTITTKNTGPGSQNLDPDSENLKND